LAVRERADDAGSPPDLAQNAFERIVRSDAPPVLLQKVVIGQRFLDRRCHKLGRIDVVAKRNQDSKKEPSWTAQSLRIKDFLNHTMVQRNGHAALLAEFAYPSNWIGVSLCNDRPVNH